MLKSWKGLVTKVRLPTDTEAQAEKLRYALTEKGNKIDHLNIPDTLLVEAKKVMQETTDYSFEITNQTLFKYALLNLLAPAIQKQLRHRLQDRHTATSLTKLLAVNEDPRQTKTSQLTDSILDSKDQLNRQDILLEALVSGIAWLIFDRNGLDRLPIASDGNDMFTKLRQSDLKPFIDEILAAGVDEADRQRHLDTLP